MASKAVKQKTVKKRWYEIALPQLLKGEVFSEGYAEEPEKLIGKTITASLGDVLKQGGKKHISVRLKVESVKTSTAHTEIKSLEVSAPYILRKAKKNSKINAQLIAKTSDEALVDLRLSAITNGHALTTVKKEIRKRLLNHMEKAVSETKKDALIMDLITNKIQMTIKKDLTKVYPVRSVELEKIIIKSTIKK